jgi:hypothetical protein
MVVKSSRYHWVVRYAALIVTLATPPYASPGGMG